MEETKRPQVQISLVKKEVIRYELGQGRIELSNLSLSQPTIDEDTIGRIAHVLFFFLQDVHIIAYILHKKPDLNQRKLEEYYIAVTGILDSPRLLRNMREMPKRKMGQGARRRARELIPSIGKTTDVGEKLAALSEIEEAFSSFHTKKMRPFFLLVLLAEHREFFFGWEPLPEDLHELLDWMKGVNEFEAAADRKVDKRAMRVLSNYLSLIEERGQALYRELHNAQMHVQEAQGFEGQVMAFYRMMLEGR